MSALTFTPSLELNVIDSSNGRPSCGDCVQTTFWTLVGKRTICSVSGLKKTQPVTTGMSATPRSLPASFTRMPTCPASTRRVVAADEARAEGQGDEEKRRAAANERSAATTKRVE